MLKANIKVAVTVLSCNVYAIASYDRQSFLVKKRGTFLVYPGVKKIKSIRSKDDENCMVYGASCNCTQPKN